MRLDEGRVLSKSTNWDRGSNHPFHSVSSIHPFTTHGIVCCRMLHPDLPVCLSVVESHLLQQQ